MCSRTEYILFTDIFLFQNVAVQDERHNLVLGCLHGAALAAHSSYLGRRTRFSIRSSEIPDKEYRMFAKPRRDIPRLTRQERHRQACISPETWSLIDGRIDTHQQSDQRISWSLRPTIKVGLKGGQAQTGGRSGVRDRILPHILFASYSRSMDPDFRMV